MLNLDKNTFLFNTEFDRASCNNRLDSLIKDALESKIIPLELCNGNSRILDSRCAHDLDELDQKINKFIKGINPDENKKLEIFHSNIKYEHDKTMNGFIDEFNRIGEITFKGDFNTGIFNVFRVYLNGPKFDSYFHEEYIGERPRASIRFEVGRTDSKVDEKLNNLVNSIINNLKLTFPAIDIKPITGRLSFGPCNLCTILIGAIIIISGLIILKTHI